MDLGIMMHIYIVSASIGSLFIVVCALMGQIAGGHGHTGGLSGHGGHIAAHGIGHFGHGAVGHGHIGAHAGVGHGPAIGHGSVGHAPAIGHGPGVAHGAAAGHGAGVAHGPAAGHGPGTASGQTGEGGQSQIPAQPHPSQSTTSPFHVPAPHEHGVLEKILGFFNPMVIALFLAFFGLSGIFFQAALPFLGFLTVVPAVVIGSLITRVILSAMSYAFARMTTSTAVVSEELIGTMAEVIVPITEGRTGEISYVVNSKRYTSPAKCMQPGLELPKGTPVMILDKNGHLMLVERWTDSFVDPSYDANKIDFPTRKEVNDVGLAPENPTEQIEENQ